LVACSHFYETEPVGIDTEHWFVNGVCEISTTLEPKKLLSLLLEIESYFGRDRTLGDDRPIDLDILFLDDMVIDERDLQIPHPRLIQRRFVLLPWAELAPDLVVSPWGKSVCQMLGELPANGPIVRKIKRNRGL